MVHFTNNAAIFKSQCIVVQRRKYDNMEKVISLTSEWHFVKKMFFKIGLETNLK